MMKRKNVTTGLLTIMIIVLSFGVSAWGQVNIITPPDDTILPEKYPDIPDEYAGNLGMGHCAECDWGKKALGRVPTPQTSGGTENNPITRDFLYPFDFDGEAWSSLADPPAEPAEQPVGFGPYGYCPGDNVKWTILKTGNVIQDSVTGIRSLDTSISSPDVMKNGGINNKFLFDVCECSEACEVTEGTRVGIEMLIDADGNFDTHDDGVYFADPDLDKIYFGLYHVQLSPGEYVRTGHPCGEEMMMERILGEDTRSFDAIKYYTSYEEMKRYNISDGKDLYKVKMKTSGKPFAGNPSEGRPTNTRIPVGNRVVALQSEHAGGYVFRGQEIDLGGNCLLWIDIPALRVDPIMASSIEGNKIRLRVRLLFNEEFVLCEDCNPPDYCECIIQVATIGCDTPEPNNCMFFPYAIQNLSPWGTGIAVTARNDVLPAGAYCKLTVADSAGNTASYTNSKVTRIWPFMLDSDMMSKFTMTKGASILSGPVSLKVDTNYPIHGYSFLTDGTFGAGTLPVGCIAGQCSP